MRSVRGSEIFQFVYEISANFVSIPSHGREKSHLGESPDEYKTVSLGGYVVRISRIFVSTTLGCCVALSGFAAAADESGPRAGSGGLEEVVVTAQKRVELLKDIPISVTAFSQERMDMLGANNVNGLQESTPNMNFAVQSGDQYSAKITLRGVGTETTQGGGEPGVALHIDNVYVGRNSASAIDIYDVERVEVLRGPQGTLYGRNANGGSVNIVSRRPQAEEEMSGDITVGSYDWVRARGVLNQPLSDNVYARLVVFSNRRNGYMENLYRSGYDEGDKDSQGARLQLLFKDFLGGEILIRGYANSTGGVGPGVRLLGGDISSKDGYPADWLLGFGAGGGPPVSGDVFHNFKGTVTTPKLQPLPSNLFQYRKDASEFLKQRIRGADLQGEWNVGSSALLRSISSYQTNVSDVLIDADSSELPIETRGRTNKAHQFSQEFNLLSTGNGPLTWLLGAFYYQEGLNETLEGYTAPGIYAGSLPPFAVPGGGGAQLLTKQAYDNESYAFFGQMSYKLTDDLRLTLGARETWDKKVQSRSQHGFVDLTTNFRFNGNGAKGFAPPDSSQGDWSKITWKAALDYKISPDHMVYASYSTGFKAGGFDFNSDAGPTNVLAPYQPETVKALEVGSKNTFLDGNATLNLSAFQYDYKNMQTFRLTGFGPRTDNAGSSTIKGVESEIVLHATDALHLDASIGYLDATYDDFFLPIPPPGVNLAGNRLNNAPKMTAHAGLEYVFRNGDHSVIPRLDWSYKGDTYYDRGNTPFDLQKAFSLVNARLRYDANSWYVDLFGTNLGNKAYVTAQLINPPFACGCRVVNVGEARMVGVTLGVRR